MSSMYPNPSFPGEMQPTSSTQEELSTFPALEENEAPSLVEKQPPVPTPEEAALPPEAQGEANGGPLGCCLGTVVGLLLTFLLITSTSVFLANGGFLGFATIPGTIIGACVGGYLGWKIGKRVYKEYDPPVVKQRGRKAKGTKSSTRKV